MIDINSKYSKEQKEAILKSVAVLAGCIIYTIVPEPIPFIDDLIINCCGGIYLLMLKNSFNLVKTISHDKINLDLNNVDLHDSDDVVKDVINETVKQTTKHVAQKVVSGQMDFYKNSDDIINIEDDKYKEV